jgi:hypothetical protein
VDVVYAVAVIPAGANESAWGAMRDLNTASLESPSSTFDDQRSTVRYVDAPSLFSAFACDSALMSLDGMADASGWSTLVTRTKHDLARDANHFTKVESIAAAATSQDILVITDLGIQAFYYLAVGATKLAMYIGTANVLGIAAMTWVLGSSSYVISNGYLAAAAIGAVIAYQVANYEIMKEYESRVKDVAVWTAAQGPIEQADRKGVSP